MQQCSKSRAYYFYDDDATAISTLTVHENYKGGAEKRIQTSKLKHFANILIGYRDDW